MSTKTSTRKPYEKLPRNSSSVWRYMDLAKFLSLAHSKSIYFCRADLFDDPFEGSFTHGSLEEHLKECGTDYPSNLIRFSSWIPCFSYISCWHASNFESAALWKIYGGVNSSIAIKSNIGRLKKLFPKILKTEQNDIISRDIVRVQYIDYKTQHPYLNDLAGPLCYKRQAYSYENEIRIVQQILPTCPQPRPDQPDGRAIKISEPPGHPGISLAIDLNELIECVYVAPTSPSWLLTAIKSTLGAFGLEQIPCRQSTLDELPQYGHHNA